MTHRIGTKGQVVIPKDLRERAGLAPGTEVDFAWDDGVVKLSASKRRQGPGGRFQGSGMAARLAAERRQEPR